MFLTVRAACQAPGQLIIDSFTGDNKPLMIGDLLSKPM